MKEIEPLVFKVRSNVLEDSNQKDITPVPIAEALGISHEKFSSLFQRDKVKLFKLYHGLA